MKITDKSQIELPLKCGKNVIIQDIEDNTYQIFSPIRDWDGDWRMSDWNNTILESKKYMCSHKGYNNLQEAIEENNWKLIDTFSSIQEQTIPVGTLVRVRDDAEEIYKRCGYVTGRYEVKMTGKEYPVTESDFKDVEIKDTLFASSEYKEIIEKIKVMNLKKHQTKASIEMDFSPELDKIEELIIDLKSDMMLLSDAVMSNLMKGKTVEITDEYDNSYDPIFSVKFKKN